MSKASAATKAAATAALSVDTVKGGQLAPTVQLLWSAAIDRVRSGRKSRKDAISVR